MKRCRFFFPCNFALVVEYTLCWPTRIWYDTTTSFMDQMSWGFAWIFCAAVWGCGNEMTMVISLFPVFLSSLLMHSCVQFLLYLYMLFLAYWNILIIFHLLFVLARAHVLQVQVSRTYMPVSYWYSSRKYLKVWPATGFTELKRARQLPVWLALSLTD